MSCKNAVGSSCVEVHDVGIISLVSIVSVAVVGLTGDEKKIQSLCNVFNNRTIGFLWSKCTV